MKRRSRLAVIAAARDCEPHLPAALGNLAALSSRYHEAHFVFAVSDCRDRTEERLKQWLGQGRTGTVLQLGALETSIQARTMRIAAARNACLEALQPRAGDFDHLLVADLDDVLGGTVSCDAFGRAATWLDEAGERVAVTANCLPRYYDTWALRHERWCPYDVWQPIWNRPADCSFEEALFREVFRRQIVLPAHLPPIPVLSAFGGLALYKARPALNARYQGADQTGRPVCEHVAFNQTVTRSGGRMFIFPSLQVQAGAGHLYDPAQFPKRWKIRMRGRRLMDSVLPPWRRIIAAAT